MKTHVIQSCLFGLIAFKDVYSDEDDFVPKPLRQYVPKCSSYCFRNNYHAECSTASGITNTSILERCTKMKERCFSPQCAGCSECAMNKPKTPCSKWCKIFKSTSKKCDNLMCKGCKTCAWEHLNIPCPSFCNYQDVNQIMCRSRFCSACEECSPVYSGTDHHTGEKIEVKVSDCYMYDARGSNSMRAAPSVMPPLGWWNSDGTYEQQFCKYFRPVLTKIDSYGWHSLQDGKKMNIFDKLWTKPEGKKYEMPVCWAQHTVCMAIPEFATNRSKGCQKVFNGCRRSLRHLHAMIFKPSAKDQVCNNFALKSIRGFFHDSVSSWVDGSILHELDSDMNTGLCEWGKYITALSNDTGCDPGSIISMAATLSHQACGIDLYDHPNNRQDAYRSTTINNPYGCKSNYNPDISLPEDHPTHPGEKLEEFSDLNLATYSSANEKFWVRLMNNTGFFSRYYMRHALDASFAGHVIGRVTCPVHSAEGSNHSDITTGFWDHRRIGAVGEENLKETFLAAFRRLRRTQCQFGPSTCDTLGGELCNPLGKEPPITLEEILNSSSLLECFREFHERNDNCEDIPTGPVRTHRGAIFNTHTKFNRTWNPIGSAPFANETNLNLESTYCNMPLTNFEKKFLDLPIVKVFPAFKSIHPAIGPNINLFIQEHNKMGTQGLKQDYSDEQKKLCAEPMELSILYEMTRLHKIRLPKSPILDRYLEMAWDGVGTIDSFWDSCSKGCDLNPEDNKMCKGVASRGKSSQAPSEASSAAPSAAAFSAPPLCPFASPSAASSTAPSSSS